MLKRFQSTIIVLVALVAFVCSAQRPKQLKRELSHLPPAVQQTIRDQMGNGKLDSIEKDTEDGTVSYDVEFVRDGRSRGITVDGEGELLDAEVFLDELPKVAQQTIQKLVGNGTLGEIDKSIEEGETSYDVEMTRDGKTRSFTVGAEGKLADIEVFISELPAALQAAMQKEAGEDKLGEIRKCFDDGEVSFDVEVAGTVPGRTLSFDTAGQLLSKEEDARISDTPEAVQRQIKNLVGAGKLLGISKITEDGEISYDVGVRDGGGEKTVSIGSDGKVLTDEDNK